MSNLSGIIKSIRDIMRQDAGVDGDAQRISQMVWMLFLKVFSDKEEEWELTIENYQSPIPAHLQWSQWAANEEGMTGDELLQFVNNELFESLKNLQVSPKADPQGWIVKQVFEDTYNYMKSGTLIRQVINKINLIDFNASSDRHLFNDIYENMLKELQSAGSSGEYYTPRAVTQFMTDMTAPQMGETVLDPACGTGGFLTCAIEHVRTQLSNPSDIQTLQNSFQGVEKKPLPHMLATTNLMLHGMDVPVIRHDNLLVRPYDSWTGKDQVDIILSNPPFGGTEEEGTDANFPPKFKTKETADLFMALIMRLLKDNGRAAVVLPDGTLFGEGVKTRIKEELLSKCNLHTIVRLPNGVFNPYTSIKTNLLFFTKGQPTKEVWYFEHPYPAGQKSYNKGRPINIKEFDLEKAWWHNRAENEHAWRVSVEDIAARNYNLDIKNPHATALDLGDPADLLEKLQLTAQRVKTLQQEIVTALEESLLA
ncbi:class I SAM-dependent DNA methyltransferase [Rufibacter sp. XAAS-G3-1]|uniref:type I restriction-modification system subunit M n=1 Tax=Rufibacter sp. XAAS-G3-1 TaxID=2729134 RepID=UPI0015E7068B|nr:class I SAM-dependent DNA methyltransferase [Rufibacter sp. XAAS-G3-1]